MVVAADRTLERLQAPAGSREPRNSVCFSHREPLVPWSAVRSSLVPGEHVCPSICVQTAPLEVWGDCLLFSPARRNTRGFL